jgi:sulfite reductase (NADPH) flavoprotein alpha-component
MIKNEQKKIIDALWDRLTEAERAWLAGYINGRAQSLGVGGAAAGVSGGSTTLHIFYATETGNAKAIAQQVEKKARTKGFKTKLTSLGKIKPVDLAALREPALFLSSTHGEGDPPEMARNFFTALEAAKDLPLPGLRYAVLGLGDRSYKEFCKAAEIIDAFLIKSGAKAFHDKALLDVDYVSHVPGWIDDVFSKLSPATAAIPAAARIAEETEATFGFSRLEPVTGKVRDIVVLNDRGSQKETFHVEIAFDGPLAYAPGDAAGIILPPQGDGQVPAPRLYSIASSPMRNAQEVHLTVALSKYKQPDGVTGFGICSHFLSQKKPDDEIQFYIQRNRRFRLPEDDSADIIMIGPGTGIAPFRAFMHERAERGSSGKSWLFYGDQRAHCDFLYQLEWQEMLENGSLTRCDVAFSRDQKQKVYVQHRLQENAKEVYKWLDAGARIYVCGAKSPMSEDVEASLLSIIETQGGKDRDAARAWLDQLAEDDRYVKDVY